MGAGGRRRARLSPEIIGEVPSRRGRMPMPFLAGHRLRPVSCPSWTSAFGATLRLSGPVKGAERQSTSQLARGGRPP